MPGDRDQLDRVRERFTRTAQEFAQFSLTTRRAEAEELLRMAAPRGTELALDLACGPGTFTRAFAPRVKFVFGLDLTPALLDQARLAAAQSGLSNLALACAEATALPFADASFDLAVCAYAFHHFRDPLGVARELARVLRAGGRVGLVDLVVPDPAHREANNAIERARDLSHTSTLTPDALRALLDSAGLRPRTTQLSERLRSFDDWMRIAGWRPGDPAYTQTRRLMEDSIAGDTAGFHPRRIAGSDDLQFVQTSLFVVAEKL